MNRQEFSTGKLHATRVLSELCSLRHFEALCDGTVKLTDGSVKISKAVLASGCPYFRFVLIYLLYDQELPIIIVLQKQTKHIHFPLWNFSQLWFYIVLRILYEFEEGTQQGNIRTAEPTLDITCATFELILDFIYTGKVVIDNDNIEEILKASDLLLMTDLKVGFSFVANFIHEKCLWCSFTCILYVQ